MTVKHHTQQLQHSKNTVKRADKGEKNRMATPVTHYDSKPLLDAFREMHNSARDMTHQVDGENYEKFHRSKAAFYSSKAEFSQQATQTADAAEYALQALLQEGDNAPAIRFIDQTKHALGMMALATYEQR